MKKFVLSILFVSVFCIGLGALVDKVGAKFKSDEKALALIRQARQAIGGESAVGGIKSLSIAGKTTRIFKTDGADQSEQRETEINLLLPSQVMRMEKFEKGNGSTDKTFEKHVQVEVNASGDANGQQMIFRGEGHGTGVGTGSGKEVKIVIQNPDGTTQVLTGDQAEAKIGEARSGGVVVRKISGDGVKGEVSDGHHIMLNRVGGDENGETGKEVRKVIIQKPDGTTEVLTGDRAAKIGEAHAGGFVVRKTDGDNAVFSSEGGKMVVSDGQHVMLNRTGGDAGYAVARAGKSDSDLMRLTFGLLLTAPEGSDVNYQMGGEADVDGTACNVVVAETGGSAYKLYLSKSSSLPVMLSYSGSGAPQAFTYRTAAPANGDEPKQNMVFTRKVAGPDAMRETQVKFSDYRTVDGVQLPFKWTTTMSGEPTEVFDVTSYDVNPANISEKFNNKDVKVRMMKKPDGK